MTREKKSTAIAKQNRAHARLRRALEKGTARTPLGVIKSRPESCQICGKIGVKFNCCQQSSKMSEIVGHHLFDYDSGRDEVAVFVCRRCHSKFHTGKLSTQDVINRFGDNWLEA